MYMIIVGGSSNLLGATAAVGATVWAMAEKSLMIPFELIAATSTSYVLGAKKHHSITLVPEVFAVM